MNVRGRLRTETSRTKTAGSTRIWFFNFFSQDSLMFVECPTSIRTCTARRLAVEDNDVLEDLKSQIYTPDRVGRRSAVWQWWNNRKPLLCHPPR
jgi:hypothetical protein